MRRAFTMLELIITMVILGIIVAMGTQIIAFSQKAQLKTNLVAKTQNEAQGALMTIVSALRTSAYESARFRPSVLSDEAGNTFCDGIGNTCEFLRNTSKILAGGTTLEVALIDRPFGRYANSINETRCVVNAIEAKRELSITEDYPDRGLANTNYPCIAAINSSDDGARIFRCFAFRYEGRSCNAGILGNRFLPSRSLPIETENREKIEVNFGKSKIYSEWFGVHFKGDEISNTAMFLERDVYPAHVRFENNPATNLTSKNILEASSALVELFYNIKKKNFSITNSYEIISSLQYFELVKGPNDFSRCTGDKPCTLLMGTLSYDAFINGYEANFDSHKVASSNIIPPVYSHTNNPLEVFDSTNATKFNNAAMLNQKIWRYSEPSLIANNVSKLEISDHNGVRTVTICLKRPFVSESIFANAEDIEVCKSEIV